MRAIARPTRPTWVRANLTHPKSVVTSCRTGSLTPYLAEVLVEDAFASHGAHLEVTVFPLPCEAALTPLKQAGGVRENGN